MQQIVFAIYQVASAQLKRKRTISTFFLANCAETVKPEISWKSIIFIEACKKVKSSKHGVSRMSPHAVIKYFLQNNPQQVSVKIRKSRAHSRDFNTTSLWRILFIINIFTYVPLVFNVLCHYPIPNLHLSPSIHRSSSIPLALNIHWLYFPSNFFLVSPFPFFLIVSNLIFSW